MTKYLTVADLHDRTGISSRSITHMIQYGTIPGGRKIGRRWVVREIDFTNFMQAPQVVAPPTDFRTRMEAMVEARRLKHG